MGGDFVKNLSKRPSRWECPGCKQEHRLPTGFYESPVALLAEERVPAELRSQIVREPAHDPLVFRLIDRAARALSRPVAVVLFLGFIALLSIHAASLVTASYFFPFATVFFVLTAIALLVVLPPNDRVSLRQYYRDCLAPIHPALRFLPVVLLLYSLGSYIYGWTIGHGEPLSSLPAPLREAASFSELVCVQALLMGALLFGALVLWHRARNRPS